ncbi:MAG: CpaD family pilus assembly lipoprotein [Stellaceae bacterium]
MKRPLYLLAIPVMLALAACRPGAAEYTASEAPKQLRLDSAATQVNLAFAPGSAQLGPGEGAKLQRLALSGGISPSDRVTVMTGGDPRLRELRVAAISRELLRYGILAAAGPLGGAPRDRAILSVGRYMVTLPACPDWSQDPASDFTNAKSSNFGCAMATNLGLMVASPADLAGGRELAHADGTPAVSSVVRYQTDKVKLPETTAGAAALAAPSSTGGAPAAGAPAATP